MVGIGPRGCFLLSPWFVSERRYKVFSLEAEFHDLEEEGIAG